MRPSVKCGQTRLRDAPGDSDMPAKAAFVLAEERGYAGGEYSYALGSLRSPTRNVAFPPYHAAKTTYPGTTVVDILSLSPRLTQ